MHDEDKELCISVFGTVSPILSNAVEIKSTSGNLKVLISQSQFNLIRA